LIPKQINPKKVPHYPFPKQIYPKKVPHYPFPKTLKSRYFSDFSPFSTSQNLYNKSPISKI
jgi:hypothetical protein